MEETAPFGGVPKTFLGLVKKLFFVANDGQNSHDGHDIHDGHDGYDAHENTSCSSLLYLPINPTKFFRQMFVHLKKKITCFFGN